MVGVYFLLRTISLLYGKLIVKYFDIELQICFVNVSVPRYCLRGTEQATSATRIIGPHRRLLVKCGTAECGMRNGTVERWCGTAGKRRFAEICIMSEIVCP